MGRGGRAALDEGTLFTPDETKLPCIRGAVGMRRMSKKHSSLNQVRDHPFKSSPYLSGVGCSHGPMFADASGEGF